MAVRSVSGLGLEEMTRGRRSGTAVDPGAAAPITPALTPAIRKAYKRVINNFGGALCNSLCEMLFS